MPKPVINLDELVLELRPTAFAATRAAAKRFGTKMAQIAPLIGAQKPG